MATIADSLKPKQKTEPPTRIPSRIPSYLRPLSLLDTNTLTQTYPGNGTSQNPYIITYLPDDHQDAQNLSKARKWTIAISQAMTFFALTFGSSIYASGIQQIEQDFHTPNEVAILGLALYVLGFALGPILWAPMSEVYGRRLTFMVSYTIYMAFTIATPAAQNVEALLVLRLLSGAFGSSAQTNPGGMIADLFIEEERGPVMAVFAACPFLGPALGPVVGGFIAETKGWRWTLWVNAILNGVVWIVALLVTRETYAPVILRARARALSRKTGKVYVSQLDAGKPPKTLSKELKISLARPWIFLVREPIVLFTSIYISIIYATLYMFFAAIPIVFEGSRRWSQGTAGLPFVGVAVGVCLAVVVVGVESKSYLGRIAAAGKALEPEAKLHSAMMGSVILPIGLFLFAWTTYPSVHWIAPVIGATFFSVGLVMLFIALISYLVSSYTFYAASALAANTIVRSLFAAAFPLFTTKMYEGLGDQWASSIPAFLVVGCLPFPFLFWRYGSQIRRKCRYAAEAAEMAKLMSRPHAPGVDGEQKEVV
ncbi:Efflux pump FUB11 [Pseudocercospora fuligena]|uniref:Cercosporin MFS transporter CTB4 n=1 Tax=Pseudocercospora fuligena TaxID=685502 RepID=A0A8H6RME7_9PEZI|nr:Efflux pump FUB11 [Pseudocercospora fuligena]